MAVHIACKFGIEVPEHNQELMSIFAQHKAKFSM